MTIVIAGGSAAGLFAALLLARTGHDVVVIERDRLDPAPDVATAAAAAFRRSAPQIVQPHLIMARCRELLMPGMVCLPEEVYTDPHVVACTREALSRYGSGPPVAQPIREQLLAALSQ